MSLDQLIDLALATFLLTYFTLCVFTRTLQL